MDRLAQQERDTLRQYGDQINQRYEASQNRADDLKEKLHESQAVAARRLTRIATLEDTVDRLQRERDSSAEHREGFRNTLTDTEKQLAACQQRISDLSERVAAADDRDRVLSDQNHNLLKEKTVLQSQLKQLQRSLAK